MTAFIYSDENSDAIKSLFKEEGKIKCAIAFLGGKLVELIHGLPGNVEIICNLECGATNPYAVERLIAKGVKLRTNRRLHAKVYLALGKVAIVGSANASANGLSYEDEELKGWIEAAIQVTDKEILSHIQKWLQSQWESAQPVTPEAITKAKATWQRRRSDREFNIPDCRSMLSILRESPQQFKDRNIFIAIHRVQNPTQEAVDKFSEIARQLNINEVLSFWEDWSDLPENSHFISLYYGRRNGFRFEGIFYVPRDKSDFIEEVEHDNGASSEILICFLRNSIESLELSEEDVNLLRDKVELLWHHENPVEKDAAVYLSLYEARNILYPDP